MSQANPRLIEAAVARLLSRQEAEREDRVFWHSKTPEERLAAAEQLRQVAFGYDAARPNSKYCCPHSPQIRSSTCWLVAIPLFTTERI